MCASPVRSPRGLRASLLALAALLTVLALPAPANAAFGYLSEWGGLSNPMGIATDAAGNVYVAECMGDDVEKYDANGTPDATWAASAGGNPASYAGCARDVAVDATGVYVVDFGANVVKKFSSAGTLLTQFNGSGVPSGVFDQPKGVATDGTNVYVIDTGPTDALQPRLLKFDTAGNYVAQIGSEGTGDDQYSYLMGVGAEPGFVYAADQGHVHSLKKWTSAGVFEGYSPDGVIQTPNNGSLDPDGGGNVYAADFSNNRIIRLQDTGTLLEPFEVWGGIAPGNGPAAFDRPMDVATGPSSTLYIADTYNNRIVKYGEGAASATTGDATNITGTTATLNGTVNPGGTATSYRFQYGTTEAYGSTTSTVAAGSGTTDVPATANLTGLAMGQTYHYRVVAVRGTDVVATGADRTFTTTGLPTVTTGDATNVTWLTGTLNGTINPQGTGTQYQFQYGTTTSYGSVTPATPGDAGAGSADVAVTGALTGLMAQRTYHYRLVALRGGSVVATGADRTFTTWPDPGTAPSCGRVGHTIGVVGVCADTMTHADGNWTASGNVVLNTGVGVSGPVVLNDSSGLIRSTAGVTVTVNRNTPIDMGTGLLEIATGGITDPVSNRSGLGLLTISNPLGIVLGAMPFAPLASHYLDTVDGGGVILTGRPSFDLLGPLAGATLPTGSFSVGMHRTHPKPFNVLGGSVKWDAIKLSALWEIGFNVSYAEGPPSLFSFMGKFKAPFLPADTGAEFSGAFAGSRLDQAGIKITTPGVPLGNTGIIMDTFAGSLKGISGGANNPLIISVTVGGGWVKTNAPDPFNWILHIKDVGVTLDTSGSGTLAGEVDVLDGEGRLVKATASLTIQIAPSFLASGSLIGTFNAGLVSTNLNFTAAMNTSHFTARGDVSGKILGTTVGSASGVLSDAGVGVTTNICVPYWWFGWHEACSDLGAGLAWSKVTSWPPAIEYIGSDINRYVTLTASAATQGRTAATTRTFAVRKRNPFLHIEARGGDSAAFELVSPLGIRYRPGSTRRDTASQTIDDVTTMVVYGPPKGTWRLRSLTGKTTRYAIQTIPDLGRVRPVSVRPAGTKTKRLSPCASNVRVSWRRDGFLPSDTRLSLYTATSSKAPGKRLRSGLRTTGRASIKVGALHPGANYLYLVPKSEGVEFGQVRFSKPVWTKAPALGQLCTSAIKPASTRTRPLSRRVTSIRLAWSRVGSMPAGTRLLLYRATSATGAGKLLRSGLPTTGTASVKVGSLARGANHLYLVPRTPDGVRLAKTRFPAPAWKR